MSRRIAPAAERNKQPILEALRGRLPATGTVLEVAAGTGQHSAFLAAALPGLRFAPTDLDSDNLASIDAWGRELPNVDPARRLDATADPATWPAADVVYCANMIHIAPWAAAEGLFAGAGRIGRLFLYGPFRFGGAHIAESNLRFDGWLKAQDAAWGVRDVEALDALAARVGLRREDTLEMPANNHILVFG